MVLFLNQADAATYYVSASSGNDANPGTQSSPWKTIAKATSTLVAGDTVNVLTGTYNEVVNPKNSGMASAPITYQGSSGTMIDGTGLHGDQTNGQFNIVGKSYISVFGFNFIHAYGNGIHLDSSNNIKLGNNTFNSDFGWNPINIFNGNHDIEVFNNYINRTYVGTYPWGQPWAEMISVDNGSNISVHDNTIDYNQLGEGIDFKDGTNNSQMFRNKVSNTNQSTSLYVDGWQIGASFIDIYDNIVTNPTGPGIGVANELMGIVHDLNIYNNIVYSTSIGLGIGYYGHGLINNLVVSNNTIYNSQVAINMAQTWNSGDVTVTNVIFNNNLLDGDTISVGYGAGEASNNGFYNSGPAFGTSPVSGNPLFVNLAAMDFHLALGSPYINSGTSSNAPVTDFDGNVRPQGGAFDIGAYEYVSVSRDTIPPSVPSNPLVSSVQITLAWTASTDNVGVAGYDIYRNGTKIGTSTTNSYVDAGLSPGSYTYTVDAYDAAGNVSARSLGTTSTIQ